MPSQGPPNRASVGPEPFPPPPPAPPEPFPPAPGTRDPTSGRPMPRPVSAPTPTVTDSTTGEAPKPRPPWGLWVALAVVAVPVSSLLGLFPLMTRNGADALGALWRTNLWGDLLFTAGTVGSFLLSAYLVPLRQGPSGVRFTVAVATGAALHAAVYIASIALSLPAAGKGFLSFAPAVGTLLDAWAVVQWGLVGLVAMAFAGPLVGLFLPQRKQAVPQDR